MSRRLMMLALLLLLVASFPANAQFGKNKINYERHDWQVYEAPHFDIYYYFEDEATLIELVSEAESAYAEFARRLDHDVSRRIPLILYETHADFLRTNVELVQLPEAVGAFAEPFQFRMVLPIDDPRFARYRLLRHELIHVFQFDILFGGSLRRTLEGQAPLWFMEGMASYLADDENSFDQMAIRDAVVNNLMPSIENMSRLGFLTYRYGHAVFDFIESEFGPEGLKNLLFEVRKALLAQNIEKAFRDAFNMTVPEFDRRFARFLRKRYLPILTDKRSPDEYGKEIGLTKPGRYTFSPTLSPSGELIAALATPGLELDVVVLSARNGEVLRNLTKGFTSEYESIVTGAFDGQRDLSWAPDGDRVAFFVKKENYFILMIYDPIEGRKLEEIAIREITQCTSPSFSPDGRYVAFSGNREGRWDLFRYDLQSGQIENLTDDRFHNSNPAWSPDGQRIIYNRRIAQYDKIFSVEIGSPQRKTQLTTGRSSDIQPILSGDGRFVYFSSDRGEYGVFNIHRLELETGEIERLTDLVGGGFSPVELPKGDDGAEQLAYTAFSGGTFRLFRMSLGDEDVAAARKAGEQEPDIAPPTLPGVAGEQERRDRAEEAGRAGTGGGEEQAGEDAEELAELRPFEAPLELRVDDDKKSPYRKKWVFDSPGIAVGLANDGSVLTDVSLQWSDILGDQRIILRSQSVSSYTDTSLTYLNLTGRMDWGANIRDYRNYYLTADIGGFLERERSQRYSAASAFAHYPLSRYYRLEGSLGYVQRRSEYPIFDGTTIDFLRFEDDYPIASINFVGDTTRYQSFGPYHGHRFRVGVTGYSYTSGDNDGESVMAYNWDFRFYKSLTRRSLIAIRLAGIYQDGEAANLYTLGGLDDLRGFRYREFVGENVAYANFELRFPLIDFLRWGFGGFTGPFRGFVFADVGTAWFEDQPHFTLDGGVDVGRAVWDSRAGVYREFISRDDDGKLVDLHATAGFGFRVPILGLPTTWSWSKVWDGDDFGDWRSDFYITFVW